MHPKRPARQGPPASEGPSHYLCPSVCLRPWLGAFQSLCLPCLPLFLSPAPPPPSFEVFLDLSLLPLYLSLLLTHVPPPPLCAPSRPSPPRSRPRPWSPHLSAQASSTHPGPRATLLGASRTWKPAPPPPLTLRPLPTSSPPAPPPLPTPPPSPFPSRPPSPPPPPPPVPSVASSPHPTLSSSPPLPSPPPDPGPGEGRGGARAPCALLGLTGPVG